MKTKEWRNKVKREGWRPGPWDGEPDKKQWVDAKTGYPCLVVRNEGIGNLCGYVGVPKGHPAYGLHYDGITQADADINTKRWNLHSRLYSAAGCPPISLQDPHRINPAWSKIEDEVEKKFGPRRDTPAGTAGVAVRGISVHGGLTYADKCSGSICHDPDDGEPDDVWWFGFDCAHSGDVCPWMDRHYQSEHEKYKDVRYVESEVASLAKQLKAMETINDNHKPMREEG